MKDDQTKKSGGALTAAVAALGLCLGSVTPMGAVAEEHEQADTWDTTSTDDTGSGKEADTEEPKKDEKRRPRRGGPCAL